YETRLGDKERAVELYREILSLSPGHQDTLAALEKLKTDSQVGVLAARVLETVYEQHGDAAMLVEALTVQANAADEPYRAVEILERMAVLLEDSLAEPRRAFEALGKAVSLDPESESLRQNFERLALLAEQPERASAIYDAVLSKIE